MIYEIKERQTLEFVPRQFVSLYSTGDIWNHRSTVEHKCSSFANREQIAELRDFLTDYLESEV